MSDSELLQVLKEILKWVRFSGLENVRLELTRSLDTDPKRLIYHLSDGTLSSQEIALKVKVSDFTVRNYWSQWYRSVYRRGCRSFFSWRFPPRIPGSYIGLCGLRACIGCGKSFRHGGFRAGICFFRNHRFRL